MRSCVHILFLTDNFPPETNAPASRTFEHARQWVKAGHKITIITCAPNFPKGKLFDGYRNWLWQTETIDGIRIIRVWTYITANTGFMLRTLDYLSFMLMAILISPFIRKVDVVVGTSPHIFTVVAAFVVSRLKLRPFVFELRDLWPASIKAVGLMKNSIFMHLLVHMEMFLYRKANCIISVTRSFKTVLINRGIAPNKIKVITNGVDLKLFRPSSKDQELLSELELKNYFVCGYIGTLGIAHGLETLIDCARILQNKKENKIKILFVGNGACKDNLFQKVQEQNIKNIIFKDTVSRSQVVKYWSLLDASIIHLRQDDVFKSVIPSKIFESMAMGIPLIHAVPGESADIVDALKCGVCIPSENSLAMVNAILDLKTNISYNLEYKKNCLKGAHQYNRNKLASNMLEALKDTVTQDQ